MARGTWRAGGRARQARVPVVRSPAAARPNLPALLAAAGRAPPRPARPPAARLAAAGHAPPPASHPLPSPPACPLRRTPTPCSSPRPTSRERRASRRARWPTSPPALRTVRLLGCLLRCHPLLSRQSAAWPTPPPARRARSLRRRVPRASGGGAGRPAASLATGSARGGCSRHASAHSRGVRRTPASRLGWGWRQPLLSPRPHPAPPAAWLQ